MFSPKHIATQQIQQNSTNHVHDFVKYIFIPSVYFIEYILCITKNASKPCKIKVLKHFHTRGANQIRTGDRGVADLCLTTWPWRPIYL